jgi:GDP-L-fucose synthase
MILVTGGSGVLGRAVVAELSRQGRDFAVLEGRGLDLRDAAATLAYFEDLRPTQVLHLAARVHGLQGNKTFPAEMFVDNVRINANVIDAARRVGVAKVVGASTVAIYSSDAVMPTPEGAIWVGPPHSSESSYGHAKRAMLAHLEACRVQYGLDYAYPIFTNLYGPSDRFDPVNGHVIPALISKFYASAISAEGVPVWGTGRAERDFLFSEDAARALILIADRFSGPINVATGDVVPIRSAVELLKGISGVSLVEWDATKPDGQLLRRYDITKLMDLGFRIQTSLEDGLRKTYEWYAGNFPNIRRL